MVISPASWTIRRAESNSFCWFRVAGYSTRFGVTYVDYKTQKRYLKASARFLVEVSVSSDREGQSTHPLTVVHDQPHSTRSRPLLSLRTNTHNFKSVKEIRSLLPRLWTTIHCQEGEATGRKLGL